MNYNLYSSLNNKTMRRITLIEGVKGVGKSTWIINKYDSIKDQCQEIDIKNIDDINTVIYILKNNFTGKIIILNSGSDTYNIIQEFKTILAEPLYSSAEIYTAIRSKQNPRLHDRMINALSITSEDEVKIIPL